MALKTGTTVEKASILHEQIADGRSSYYERRVGDRLMIHSSRTLILNCKWPGIEIDIDDVSKASEAQALQPLRLCIQLNACRELKCVFFKLRMKKRVKSIFASLCGTGGGHDLSLTLFRVLLTSRAFFKPWLKRVSFNLLRTWKSSFTTTWLIYWCTAVHITSLTESTVKLFLCIPFFYWTRKQYF